MKKILILLLVTTGYCFGSDMGDPYWGESLNKAEVELFKAISAQDPNHVKSVLQQNSNIDVNVKNKSGNTPLLEAVHTVSGGSAVRAEIVGLLLRHGADVDIKNELINMSFNDFISHWHPTSKKFITDTITKYKEELKKNIPLDTDTAGIASDYII